MNSLCSWTASVIGFPSIMALIKFLFHWPGWIKEGSRHTDSGKTVLHSTTEGKIMDRFRSPATESEEQYIT